MNSPNWTADEIHAAVEAYLWMLGEEASGRPYVKAEVRRDLMAGGLSGRSNGSIEMRMCNISTVLDSRGLAFVKGYKPRTHVGSAVQKMIERSLEQLGHT